MLRTTFDETMRSTGKDAVGLLDLISVRPDKETTFKVLCERPHGAGLGELLEAYASTPRPGILIRSMRESFARFSELRLDLNGAFTRLALSLGPGPSFMKLEADSIITAALAHLNSRERRFTEEAMWRGVISSTNNAQEKKFLIGLALSRKPDMSDELLEEVRDFSYYEEVGEPVKSPQGKVWGNSRLFLKTQGHAFRIETHSDAAVLISSDESSLSFLRLPDNSERFCSHLKSLGIKTVLKRENGEFITAQTEQKIALRIGNLRIGQEVPNYAFFRAPVKVTFVGFKCRVDTLPQTSTPGFRVDGGEGSGTEIIDAWVNNSHLNLANFAKYPNYLKEIFQCYMRREQEVEAQFAESSQADMTDEAEVLNFLKAFVEASDSSQKESLAGKSLREILMHKVDDEASKRIIQESQENYNSEEDDGGFDRWGSSDEEEAIMKDERFSDLSLRVDPDLIKELGRHSEDAKKGRELLYKLPKGVLEIFFRIESDLEEGVTSSELISSSIGILMEQKPRGASRTFN